MGIIGSSSSPDLARAFHCNSRLVGTPMRGRISTVVRGCEGTGDEVDGVTAAETVHAQKRPEGAEQAQVVFGVSFDDSGDNVGEVGLGIAGRSGGQ